MIKIMNTHCISGGDLVMLIGGWVIKWRQRVKGLNLSFRADFSQKSPHTGNLLFLDKLCERVNKVGCVGF